MLKHGGNLQEAASRFGRPLDDWLDLSTGINPRYYPVPSLESNAWHRLPEKSPALLKAAQDYYNAPAMLAVAGTQAAIQALPHLRAPSRVVVSAPSYAEHAHQWRKHGHQVSEVSYQNLGAQIGQADVVVVCNPNNPTGEIVSAQTLLTWAQALRARKGWLVVDEAFADMQPQLSVGSFSSEEGLIVLRSPGKFFGLAGLRLGFVAAHTGVLQQLEDHLGPWAVSGPAQEIACIALQDGDWQQASRLYLCAQGRRLRQLLLEHGLESQGTELFRWCSDLVLGEQTESLWHHLAEQGIWVRLFLHKARGLRFGLPRDEAGWHRLQQALHTWRNAHT